MADAQSGGQIIGAQIIGDSRRHSFIAVEFGQRCQGRFSLLFEQIDLALPRQLRAGDGQAARRGADTLFDIGPAWCFLACHAQRPADRRENIGAGAHACLPWALLLLCAR